MTHLHKPGRTPLAHSLRLWWALQDSDHRHFYAGTACGIVVGLALGMVFG